MNKILLLMLVAGNFLADEVGKYEQKFQNKLAQYKQEYDEQCHKYTADYLKALKRLQQKIVKTGDLEGALKVKARIDALTSGNKLEPTIDINNVDIRTNPIAPIAPIKVAPIKVESRNPKIDFLQGKWHSVFPHQKFWMDIKDYTVTHSNGAGNGTIVGTLSIIEDKLFINWSNKKRDIYKFSPDSSIRAFTSRLIYKKLPIVINGSLVGTWYWYDGKQTYTFYKDGTFKDNLGFNSGTWKKINITSYEVHGISNVGSHHLHKISIVNDKIVVERRSGKPPWIRERVKL